MKITATSCHLFLALLSLSRSINFPYKRSVVFCSVNTSSMHCAGEEGRIQVGRTRLIAVVIHNYKTTYCNYNNNDNNNNNNDYLYNDKDG